MSWLLSKVGPYSWKIRSLYFYFFTFSLPSPCLATSQKRLFFRIFWRAKSIIESCGICVKRYQLRGSSSCHHLSSSIYGICLVVVVFSWAFLTQLILPRSTRRYLLHSHCPTPQYSALQTNMQLENSRFSFFTVAEPRQGISISKFEFTSKHKIINITSVHDY